jgi:pimeloyl-ACP methyl ester carboxylesterase
VTSLDAPTDYGRTHLLAAGDETAADMAGWLDQVLDWLGAERAALAGHSYGAWLALRYALHAPARVSRLVLFDPTSCFAPLSLAYRLRSIPLLAAPGAGRARRLFAWETRGRPLDPDWLAVATAGADLGRLKIVRPAADAGGTDPPGPARPGGGRQP